MLRVAAELFRNKGYDRSTMDDVAREVGILKGSLYYYFDSKQEILDEILLKPREHLLKRLERIVASDAPATKKLGQAITEFVTAFDIEYPAMSVAVYERFDRSVEQRDQIRHLRRRVQEIFEQIVQEGISEGSLRTDNVKMATFAIAGMCNWLSTWYQKDGELSAQSIGDLFADLILNGLVVRDDGGGNP
jgi:AcrR family transcriptional regulator